MKTILLSLLTLLILSTASAMPAHQTTLPDPPPDQIEICVSIVVVTVCYTWDLSIAIDKPIEVKGNVRDNQLLLAGFPRGTEGATITISEKEPLIPTCGKASSDYVILPGKYKVNRGTCAVALARRETKPLSGAVIRN